MNGELKQDINKLVDSIYTSGQFFERSTGSYDAAYKVNQLRQLLLRSKTHIPQKVNRIADVGCGAGKTTFLLQEMIKNTFGGIPVVNGYDVHPYIRGFPGNDLVHFVEGDFCVIADGVYDLVVLFDVIEHVSDPMRFIREASRHARLLALHIPLDDSVLSWIRNLPLKNLAFPGHILVLDTPAALNLLTLSGLRILDFEYSPGFQSPSGQVTFLQKVLYPLRAMLFRVSPYLTQKLLAGVSLTVLAQADLEYPK